MATKRKSGAVKVLDTDGKNLIAKVGRIQIGNIYDLFVDGAEQISQALRSSGPTARLGPNLKPNSSKVIVFTGGKGDSSSGDPDFF